MSELEQYAGYDALSVICTIEDTSMPIIVFSTEKELIDKILSLGKNYSGWNKLNRELSAAKR